MAGSQFIITLGDELDYLDGKAAIFGKVVEGFDALEKINDAFCDEKGRPLVDIRIKHTVILDDPYDDPSGLIEPPESPLPSKTQLATVRIGEDDKLEGDGDAETVEKLRREREARAQALTLEMVGDLPFAEVKPPENVLFVCKLNPVTTGSLNPCIVTVTWLTTITDEDLELIFSRFGKILSCEVIRDKRTGDSLQYAFIEYEEQASCEQAYFKMQGVLIDDHRIHVDFSQSVSKLSDTWRDKTNQKRRQGGGGFGGVSGLEKKRQYKAADYGGGRRDRYGMVYDEEELRRRHEKEGKYDSEKRERSRSRSPQRERGGYDDRRGRGGRDRDRDRYDDRDRDRRRGRDDSYRPR